MDRRRVGIIAGVVAMLGLGGAGIGCWPSATTTTTTTAAPESIRLSRPAGAAMPLDPPAAAGLAADPAAPPLRSALGADPALLARLRARMRVRIAQEEAFDDAPDGMLDFVATQAQDAASDADAAEGMVEISRRCASVPKSLPPAVKARFGAAELRQIEQCQQLQTNPAVVLDVASWQRTAASLGSPPSQLMLARLPMMGGPAAAADTTPLPERLALLDAAAGALDVAVITAISVQALQLAAGPDSAAGPPPPDSMVETAATVMLRCAAGYDCSAGGQEVRIFCKEPSCLERTPLEQLQRMLLPVQLDAAEAYARGLLEHSAGDPADWPELVRVRAAMVAEAADPAR